MNEKNKEKSRSNRGTVAALVSGLLLHIAILLLWADGPNDVVGLQTGISAFPYADRNLKYPLAGIFFFVFCWWTVTLYRKRLIPLAMQFWCVCFALLLGWLWIFIGFSQLNLTFIK